MPVTLLAHQAPVLPLKLRWPGRFDGLALVVGSMMPDAWYVSQMPWYSPWGHPLWRDGHHWSAIIQQVVLPTMLVSWALRRYVMPSVPRAFGARQTYRHGDLSHVAEGSPRWWVTAYSAFVGGATHLLLDELAELPGGLGAVADVVIDLALVAVAVIFMRRIRRQRWLRYWAPRDVGGVPPQLGGGPAMVVRVGTGLGLAVGLIVSILGGRFSDPGGSVRIGMMTLFVITALVLFAAGAIATFWEDRRAAADGPARDSASP